MFFFKASQKLLARSLFMYSDISLIILPTATGNNSVLGAEIVREKVLLLENKMSPADACDMLEQVGHDFFVFADENDGTVKIVYKRRYHGYGLLIPQIDA